MKTWQVVIWNIKWYTKSRIEDLDSFFKVMHFVFFLFFFNRKVEFNYL